MEDNQKIEAHFGKVERRGNKVNFSIRVKDDGDVVDMSLSINTETGI